MRRSGHLVVLIPLTTVVVVSYAAAVCRATTADEQPGEVLQTFELREHFGVAHPDQVIDFDLPITIDPSNCKMIGPAGVEVPYQLLRENRIAVRTDLPAGATKQWKLVRGKPSPGADGVQVKKMAELIEITNGLTGIRLPNDAYPADRRPARQLNDLFNYGPDAPRLHLPAPVQGVLLRDGRWTGQDPNLLVVVGDRLQKRTVEILEQGPLVVVARLTYEVEHPEYAYGALKLKPAGTGYYRSTITMQAGQPSILFEEDTDLEMTWAMNVYSGVEPSHARYRGHHSTEKQLGYQPDGEVYGPSHARGGLDAQVDLSFDAPRSWPKIAAWDPWSVNTGWYWQLFNAGAKPEANIVGIFAGRASLAVGTGASGVALFTLPADASGAVTGIEVSSYRRSASNQVYPRSRFHWGLFVGTKGEDLRPPAEVQSIGRQSNLHAGFNLNKIHRYSLDFEDPPGGYGGLYMDRETVEAFKHRLRADKAGPHGQGLHGYLWSAEPSSRPLIEMWTDATGQKRREAVELIARSANEALSTYVNGEGIYSLPWHYWHAGLQMMRHGIWIDQLLAEPGLTDEERRKVKAAAVLFANVLWDNDFVPLDNHEGINLGTPNMPVQQSNYRAFYALLLARHPLMATRARAVEDQVRARLPELINEHGAEIGCPHYIGASLAPTLNTLLQIKQLGGEDPFQAEPRLAKFAEFYMQLMTPPEPRVGNRRAMIALGDGSTEPSETYGTLATGFRDADPALSKRLMGAWIANGKPHSGFFGTTILNIDDQLPAADPQLGDATFPGYMSVLRSGWGTPDETALWFINGEHYADHRHYDHGSVVIYALGAPLSLDWGSIYTPRAAGSYLHNCVTLEETIGHAWDKDGTSLDAGKGWGHSTQEVFQVFPEAGFARGRFTIGTTSWRRSVLVLRGNPAQPVFVIRDQFEGEKAGAAKIATLQLMAEGPVETPSGMVDPPRRSHPVEEAKGDRVDYLASTTLPMTLPGGVHRFGFRGRYGLACDVYVVAAESQQALIGNWSVTPWGPAMTDKQESQHILRVRGTGEFLTVVVPWRSDAPRPAIAVTQNDNQIHVTAPAWSANIGHNGYSWKTDSGTVERRWE